MNTEPSEYWASLDQYTSFSKDPWGFNRPENRKEHNVLSKATFVEWPNTTSDFSLHGGVAPAGKLAVSHRSRFVNPPPGSEKFVSSSPSPKMTTSKNHSCAVSDAQLRATVSTNSNCLRSADGDGAVRATTTVKKTLPRASSCMTTTRHSAENVTAAYTLLQRQATAERRLASEQENESTRRTATPTAASPTHQGTTLEHPQQLNQDHRPKTSSISYDWSVKNIGFNDIKSEARKRMERENREGYERASFASCDADKPYIAEAAHFRFRYPHTLGRIQALSETRSDRVSVRRDRARASDDCKLSGK